MAGANETEQTMPSDADVALVMRLLAFETRAAASAQERADGATRLFDKTFAVLSPILGGLGVQAIFERSVRLAKREFACLEEAEPLAADGRVVDARQCLRNCRRDGEDARYVEIATALYARFFALVSALIGEQLATRIILMAWPDLAETSTATKGTEG